MSPRWTSPHKRPITLFATLMAFCIIFGGVQSQGTKRAIRANFNINKKKRMFPRKNRRHAAAETKTALNLELSDKKLMKLLNKHSFEFLGT